MTNFDDYYGSRDNRQSRANNLHVRQYNRWVEIVLQAIQDMIRAANATPPKTCDWVLENGVRKASWELLREYEDSYRIHLMPDGRLVYVQPPNYPSQELPEVKKTIRLRRISRQSDEASIGVNWSLLSDLCSNIVTMGLGRFGLPSGNLHDDLLAHWSRTHPADNQANW